MLMHLKLLCWSDFEMVCISILAEVTFVIQLSFYITKRSFEIKEEIVTTPCKYGKRDIWNKSRDCSNIYLSI